MKPSRREDSNRRIPESVRRAFPDRLRFLMLARGLTQQQLATAADVGKDSMSQYMNGKHFPSPRALLRIAEALGVGMDELLPSTDDTRAAAPPTQIEMRQIVGEPDKVMLRVQRKLPLSVAVQIMSLIGEAA